MFLMTTFWYSCQEKESNYYLDDSPAPAPVTIREVVNTHGGAVIRYTIPQDKNLLGVKAVYERNGEICETKSSMYLDSLVIEGFGDTEIHDVTVYSIGRNEKLSTPVPVKITPLTPIVHSVKVQMTPSFGGVSLTFENPAKASLAFVLIKMDSKGLWTPLQTFYAGAASGRFSQRGLTSDTQKFGLYVRDRWLNLSDTLIETLTPWEEVEIPKNTFKNAKLPTDSWSPAEGLASYNLEWAWDGILFSSGWVNVFASTGSSPMPQHFTISLGRKVSLSRLKVNGRDPYDTYAGGAVRTFEVWGTDDPPANGSFDNWHLLGRWELFKPSGYGAGNDVGPISSDDRAYFASGGDYELEPSDEVPDPFQTITYIRFRTLSTFQSHLTMMNTGGIFLAELTFFGQLKDN
jgi:hypothetical protein